MNAGKPGQHQAGPSTVVLGAEVTMHSHTLPSVAWYSVSCQESMPAAARRASVFLLAARWSERGEPADHAAALSSLLRASQIGSISVSTASRL
jgi:hypothetical protein